MSETQKDKQSGDVDGQRLTAGYICYDCGYEFNKDSLRFDKDVLDFVCVDCIDRKDPYGSHSY